MLWGEGCFREDVRQLCKRIEYKTSIRWANGPTACQIFHLVILSSIHRFLIIGRRPGTPDPLNPCVDVPWATPGCYKDRVLLIFRRPKMTSKSQRFSEVSKIDQNNILNRPWCDQGSFFMKKHDFGHPFWASIFRERERDINNERLRDPN